MIDIRLVTVMGVLHAYIDYTRWDEADGQHEHTQQYIVVGALDYPDPLAELFIGAAVVSQWARERHDEDWEWPEVW